MLRMLINGHICLSLIDTSRRRRRLEPVSHMGATATAWADNCLPCVFVWGWQIHNHPLKILHLGAARRLWGDRVIVCGWLVSVFLLLISLLLLIIFREFGRNEQCLLEQWHHVNEIFVCVCVCVCMCILIFISWICRHAGPSCRFKDKNDGKCKWRTRRT